MGRERRGKKNKVLGFSMLEIPVALMIFTIGLLFLFGMLPASYRSIAEGRDVLSGVQLARYLLENTENQSYDTASLSTAQTLYSVLSTDNGNNAQTSYYYQITVSPRLQSCGAAPFAACTSVSACNSCTGQDDAARLSASVSKDIEVFVYSRFNASRAVRLDTRVSR